MNSTMGPLALAAALAGALAMATMARAEPATYRYEFTASQFGPAAPLAQIRGTVAVTLDPEGRPVLGGTAIKLERLSVPFGSILGFDHDPVSDRLILGGARGVVSTSGIDFRLEITGATGPAPRAIAFAYCQAPCSGQSFVAQLVAVLAHRR